MENNRNFLITIALSVLILTLWQVFYMNPRIEAQREAAQVEAERVDAEKQGGPAGGSQVTPAPEGAVPALPGNTAPGSVPGTDGTTEQNRDKALAATQRVKVDTPSLSGSINLAGGRLDDLKLKQYRLTVEPNSPEIELLNPQSLPNGYFAEVGFVAAGDAGNMPQSDTIWTVDGPSTLTPTTPVTLSYTNDKGLTFQRTFSADNDYMFTVTDTVKNGSSDGWLGITDKYWAVALVPSAKQAFQPRASLISRRRPTKTRYQADFLTDP
jgi:YidC/Oxa1 family membrane protein insertase